MIGKGKPIVNMTNWELYVYDGRYSLSGTADKHPRLGNHIFVAQTSELQDYCMEGEVLFYETLFTLYSCPLKYMTATPYRDVTFTYKEQLTHQAECSDSILDKIIAASAQMSMEYDRDHREMWSEEEKDFDYTTVDYSENEYLFHIRQLQTVGQKEIEEQEQKEKRRLTDIAEQYEDCVYIEVSNVAAGDMLAYHLRRQSGTVKPWLHSGMFQDSVMYMKYWDEKEGENACALDFRYFPKGWNEMIMETYSWSDNIRRAVIKNMRDCPLEFNHQTIQPGETKVFTPEGHVQGLISPDCYNGKSFFGQKR